MRTGATRSLAADRAPRFQLASALAGPMSCARAGLQMMAPIGHAFRLAVVMWPTRKPCIEFTRFGIIPPVFPKSYRRHEARSHRVGRIALLRFSSEPAPL